MKFYIIFLWSVGYLRGVCIRRVEKFYKNRATMCGYIDLLEVVDAPLPFCIFHSNLCLNLETHKNCSTSLFAYRWLVFERVQLSKIVL